MIPRRGRFLLPAASALAQSRKRIAAVITVYTRNSHADVIATRLMEGYDYYGKRRQPRHQLVSMYLDQTPKNDLSRGFAEKHNVKIYPTVREALTLGGGKLAVDGVVLIGEHGDYPDNERGQKLYPRHRLFSEIVEVFRTSGRSVPVFSDKHLSTDWDKARWMYDQSRELRFPFMAGSSVPLAWRRPPLDLEMGSPVEHAVACFYGGKESYGFHLLESLQCMVERRRGGETGIAAVQCLEGPAVWEWTGKNPWAGKLLDAALARIEDRKPGSPQDNVKQPIVFLLDYADGLRAAAYMLNGHIHSTGVAVQVRGRPEPVSTQMWLQPGRPHAHFSGLVFYIEEMIEKGRAAYPVERTLLTTGALAALMESSYRKGERIETPHLKLRYRPARGPFYNQGEVPPMEDPKL